MKNISDAIRDDFVQKLKAAGMPVEHAHEAVDLAVHAIDSAIEKTQTICRTGSNTGVVVAATQIAFGLLSQVAEMHREGSETAARMIAAKMGVPIVQAGDQPQNDHNGSAKL